MLLRTLYSRKPADKPRANTVVIDFALRLAADITRERRPVLFFTNRDAEALFRRFSEKGGRSELVQFLTWPEDFEHFDGWVRLWKPTLVVFHRDVNNAQRPATIRGGCAIRHVSSRLTNRAPRKVCKHNQRMEFEFELTI